VLLLQTSEDLEAAAGQADRWPGTVAAAGAVHDRNRVWAAFCLGHERTLDACSFAASVSSCCEKEQKKYLNERGNGHGSAETVYDRTRIPFVARSTPAQPKGVPYPGYVLLELLYLSSDPS